MSPVGAARRAREQDQGHRREQPADRPHQRREQLRVDRRQARAVGVGGRGAHGLADVGAGEEPRERERDERHRDQHRDLRAVDLHARDRPRSGERGRDTVVLRLELSSVGKRERRRERELRDADRRDEHDHARRGEQAPDHRQLDRRREHTSDGDRDDHGGPEAPVRTWSTNSASSAADTRPSRRPRS